MASAKQASVTFTNPEPGLLQVRLSGFGVGSSALNADHRNVLASRIAPIVAGGGSISIVGHASRSGGDAANAELSLKRANAVADHLKTQAVLPVRRSAIDIRSLQGEGERAAARAGAADGAEDPYHRAVTLAVWSKPVPPPIRPVAAAPQMVPRTVKLTSATYDSGVSPAFGGDGETAAALGSIARGLLFGDNAIKNVESRVYPSNYVVTEIRVDQFHEYDSNGISNVTTDRTETHFTWGPATPSVRYVVRSRSSHIQSGRQLVKDNWRVTKSAAIPRSQLARSLKQMGSG